MENGRNARAQWLASYSTEEEVKPWGGLWLGKLFCTRFNRLNWVAGEIIDTSSAGPV